MDMNYKCSNCGKTYSRYDNLLRHIKSVCKGSIRIGDNEDSTNDKSAVCLQFGTNKNENERYKDAIKSIQIKYNALKRARCNDPDSQANENIKETVNPHKLMKFTEGTQRAVLSPECNDDSLNASSNAYNRTASDSSNLTDVNNRSIEKDYEYSRSESTKYDTYSSDDEFKNDVYEKHKVIKRRIYWNDPGKLVHKLKELAKTEISKDSFKTIAELNKQENALPNTDRELLLEEIAKTKNSIRDKHKALKWAKNEANIQMENIFKPITRPLQELAVNTKLEPIYKFKLDTKEEIEPNYEAETPISQRHFKIERTSTPLKYREEESLMSEDEFATPTRTAPGRDDSTLDASRHILAEYFKLYSEKSPKIDETYGVYYDNNEWKIGNSNLVVDDDDVIIKGKRYKATMGLCELLFMRHPVKSFCTEEDFANYRTILRDTNAYKRYNNEKEQIKGSRGTKYKEIISKLIKPQGMGLMQIPKENIDYVYWDDANELVDRLRLLIASQEAGHNNHNNEIVSIIEELKEADVIE